MTADTYNDLQRSFGRCLRDKHFIERFYTTLLASHPAIPPMFAHTDMFKQRLALRRGISIAILHAAASPLATRTVEQMADVHGKDGRAPVAPHLHAHWLASLLEVISQTDPEFSPAVLQRWSEAMGKVIDTFTARYHAGK